VLIVSADPEKVEADLAVGAVPCPGCGGPLARWGHARRREVRAEAGSVPLRPRRAWCKPCEKTHVLLPDVVLLRRVDAASVIGRALLAGSEGAGHRRVAERLGRPTDTVRGWLRRARAGARRIREHFGAWAHALDPLLGPAGPARSVLGDAVEAIAVAARAASLRLGPRPVWSWAVSLSAGALLSNTNCPWPQP